MNNGLTNFMMFKRLDDFGKYVIDLCCNYCDKVFGNEMYRNKLMAIPFLIRAKRFGKITNLDINESNKH